MWLYPSKAQKGLGYLTEMTIDIQHGIITGVDCYPASQRESDIILKHLKKQLCNYKEIALDGGYDISAVHRGLEILGVNGYTAIREYQNNTMKKGFQYDEEKDCFICMNGNQLEFKKLIYKKSTQNYYRLYSRSRRNVKNVLVFRLAQRIWVLSGLIPVHTTPLFIEMVKKLEAGSI